LIAVRPLEKNGLQPYKKEMIVGEILIADVSVDDLVELSQIKT